MADVLPSEELIEEPSDYGSLKPGERLGRYELLVPIARGGMARVWAARLHGQRGFQKLVALKTILPHLADEPEFERMFLDEARIASGVHHPNVCEIYELGDERKTLYLAMEWVSGDSLARVLRASGRTEGLDARVVARIIADACAGLHAAHELTDDDGRALGVVHRDLSPHNILLTADGTAKVADFGVAKALGQLHEATSAGQLKGKIAYMAPEQVTGQGVDRRSDVFSLGVVLYEATTGQRPFRGDGDHQVMHAVLKGEYPAPTSLLRGYPQELERIVARALSPQPILRYPTAERMRFALEEFVAKGQLVTQSNVAQVVRARIGDSIERRKERIRQASTAVEREGGWSEPPGGMTPSNANQEHGHRSGVKQAADRRLFSTMQMDRPPPSMRVAPDAPPPLPPGMQPSSSTTIPQAPAFHGQGGGHGHTPVSYPGAAFPNGPPQAYAPQPPPYPQPPPPGQPQPVSQAQTRPPPMPFGQTVMMGGSEQSSPGVPGFAPFSVPPTPSYDTTTAGTPMPPAFARGVQPLQPQGFPPGSLPPALPPSGGAYGAPFDPVPPAPPSASADRGSSPPGASQYVLAIGVGVLLAALIGVGGFLVWRGRHVTPAPPKEAAVVVTPTPVPVPPVADPSLATTTAVGTGSAAAPSGDVSTEITFRLTPAVAVLVVDGKELGVDARGVPRPAVGKTVTVVARAKGHEDTTILVDFFTTTPMEITLKPLATSAPAVGNTAATDDPPAVKDPPREPAKPKPKPKGDAIPANPY